MSDLFIHQQNSAARAIAFSIAALLLIGAVHIRDDDRIGLILVLLSLVSGHWSEIFNAGQATERWATMANIGAWTFGVAAGLKTLF